MAKGGKSVIALTVVPRRGTQPWDDWRALGLASDGRWGRWWQVAIALLGLVLLSPVSLLIAVTIKLTSRGPILYRGTRIGRDLQPFTIFKFRTLLVGSEQKIGGRLLTSNDPLYTPVGRFLKRSKLDEIPQLLNVIRGDMNLVGPRPIRPIFLATALKDIRHYGARFIVRPGMTGLAQLRGGYFTDPRDKLRYDILYIRNRRVPLDVKLVVATFVKLLNRWLTLGLLLALIFLCASFVPAVFSGPFQVQVGDFHLSPFEALGLLIAGFTVVAQIPAHRLYLYRVPTNWPMVCFALFSAAAAVFAGDAAARLRDLAYFTASGFLLYFLVVSGEMNTGFATRTTRVVALAAVGVCLVGILQVVLQNHAVAGDAPGALGVPRIASTLGSPVVLAAYLVLGLPMVLVELTCAEEREQRDFWLVCTTLLVVGVLLTQTRTGLFALWITSALFTWRASRRMFRIVVGGALGTLALMVFVGALRLGPADVGGELARRVSLTRAAMTQMTSIHGLVGPAPGKGAVSLVEVEDGPGETQLRHNDNMHLTLMLRVGVIGWMLMMWVIAAALTGIYRGGALVQDRRLGLVLWGIFSAGVGFLVSMSNFNAFYVPSIQILFWGLLGIGMAIVTHTPGRRPRFNVIYRFGQGD
jgi:lipopolysaccharide/colanic/teichoic acid biosynthesis glycosyltransferase